MQHSRNAFLLAGLAAWGFVSFVNAAHGQALGFVEPKIGKQVTEARALAYRCDKIGLRAAIVSLKKTKSDLERAAKTGVLEGAGDDANLVGIWVGRMETWLDHCKDTHPVTGLDSEKYGFETKDDWRLAAQALDAAQKAAEQCDSRTYDARIVTVGLMAQVKQQDRELKVEKDRNSSHATFLQIAIDLEAAREKMFAKCLDPCLVGTWRSEAGIVARFQRDGTQVVDYAAMKPFFTSADGAERFFFTGAAKGKISTKAGSAKIESVEESSVKLTMITRASPVPVVWDLKDRMGPGGLGEAVDDKRYDCKGDVLKFTGSSHREKKANYSVIMNRVK